MGVAGALIGLASPLWWARSRLDGRKSSAREPFRPIGVVSFVEHAERRIALVQYAVTLKDAEWTVFKDGKVIAQGMSRSRAIEQAQRLAQDAIDAQENVELVVQGYTGELSSRRTG
jgi:Uncharacterized protein conserved in bacteria (DUF2188)